MCVCVRDGCEPPPILLDLVDFILWTLYIYFFVNIYFIYLSIQSHECLFVCFMYTHTHTHVYISFHLSKIICIYLYIKAL